MARTLVQGGFAEVEITTDRQGDITATCTEHSTSDARLAPPGNCDWTRTFNTWEAATRRAGEHADTGNS